MLLCYQSLLWFWVILWSTKPCLTIVEGNPRILSCILIICSWYFLYYLFFIGHHSVVVCVTEQGTLRLYSWFIWGVYVWERERKTERDRYTDRDREYCFVNVSECVCEYYSSSGTLRWRLISVSYLSSSSALGFDLLSVEFGGNDSLALTELHTLNLTTHLIIGTRIPTEETCGQSLTDWSELEWCGDIGVFRAGQFVLGRL